MPSTGDGQRAHGRWTVQPRSEVNGRLARVHRVGGISEGEDGPRQDGIMTRLTNPQILEARLGDWRVLLNQLATRFRTGDFETGAEFVSAIAVAADAAGHHPDVTLTYPSVAVSLSTHDEGGVTGKDVDLAREISMLAEQRGLVADPASTQSVELALDTADASEIADFWSVVLTGSPDNVDDDAVTDPAGRVPPLWFQQCEPHEVPHQRFHLDITLPPEEVGPRTEAALAAGGRIGWETRTFRVLEDRQGNRACLCWSAGRNEGE